MSKAHSPELKIFMDKKLLKLNGGRYVQGILRGFDPFMNVVVDQCVEMATSGNRTILEWRLIHFLNNISLIQGNSTIMLEAIPVYQFHHTHVGTSMNNGCAHQRNQLLPCIPFPHFTRKIGSGRFP